MNGQQLIQLKFQLKNNAPEWLMTSSEIDELIDLAIRGLDQVAIDQIQELADAHRDRALTMIDVCGRHLKKIDELQLDLKNIQDLVLSYESKKDDMRVVEISNESPEGKVIHEDKSV